MPSIMDLLSSAMAGGGPPAASPDMMPPTGPPGMGGSTGLPQIPAGGSGEMASQLEAAADQVLSIGSRVYAQGQHEAAIAIARAGKELRKASEKLRQMQQVGPPPALGGGGAGGMIPPVPPGMGAPPMPGMGM